MDRYLHILSFSIHPKPFSQASFTHSHTSLLFKPTYLSHTNASGAQGYLPFESLVIHFPAPPVCM